MRQVGPVRVLHVTRIVHGGVAVVASNLVNGLNRKNYKSFIVFDSVESSDIVKSLEQSPVEVILLTREKTKSISEKQYPARNRNVAAKVETLLGKQGKEVYFFLKSLKEFLYRDLPKIKLYLNLIKKNRINLVHTHHNLTLCKPEIIAARLAGVPCVLHQHTYIKYRCFDLLFKGLVDIFIYISNDIASYFTRQGIPPEKGRLVFNGIDIKQFSGAVKGGKVRHDFGCAPHELVVGSIGRIGWWKGHEFFIQAMAIVLQANSNVKGLIVGSMTCPTQTNIEYQESLHALVKEKGLETKIIFTGHSQNIPEMMAAMDVVIHASSEPEPFGLVVIEGMAAQKPVVATAAGGVLDIIENGISGFLVPRKNPEEMAIAILTILSDTKKAKQVASAARKRVEEMFTVERQILAVEEIYKFCLTDNNV